jgi:hypothetical protein
MTSRTPENGESQLHFPLADYWEDLRATWEGDLGPGPDTSAEARIEVMWLISSLPLGRPLPPDLIVTRAEIREMLQPLSVSSDEDLVSGLFRIASRHLHPKHREYLQTDLQNIREQLQRLAAAASELDNVLEEISAQALDVVRRSYELIAEHFGQHRSVDVTELHIQVGQLATAAQWLAPQLRRKRKRPAHVLRHQTMLDVTRAIEGATGERIQTRWGKTGLCKDEFRGQLGAFVLRFMRRMEPTASEQSLVKLLRRVRKADDSFPSPPKKDSAAR